MINKKLLIHGLKDSLNTKEYYNEWSQSYEKTLQKWNYQTPFQSAKILSKYANPFPNKILDLACGTGLFGNCIKKTFSNSFVDGADISDESIKIANKKNVYNKLYKFDFQKKLNFSINIYDCVSCIGSMTYCKDPKSLFFEIWHILKKDGYFLFSHRNDLWKKQKFTKLIISKNDLWKKIYISNPIDYLPYNKDFGEKIKVKICLLKKIDK